MNNNDVFIYCDMCKVKMAKDPTNAITYDDPDEQIDMKAKFTIGTRCDEHGQVYCLDCECPYCFANKESRDGFIKKRIQKLRERIHHLRNYNYLRL